MFEFQCKKCKHLFLIEHHPLLQSVNDKFADNQKCPSSDDNLKALSEIILEITKQIRCQKCDSTVYLVRIGNLKFETGVDATSEPLVKIIKKLVDLHKEYKTVASTPESFLEYSDGVSECAQEIAEHLMWHPGALVYFEDTELMNEARIAIEDLWKSMNYNVLSDEMFSGGYSGLMVNIVGDYIERVKMIKPTFIAVRPDNETRTYFQEAMNAWSHGLNTAALILSCSIIEAILKKVMLMPGLKLNELIRRAKDRSILDDMEASKAHKIRTLRNAAVHDLMLISSKDTYEAIMSAKEVLEKILALNSV